MPKKRVSEFFQFLASVFDRRTRCRADGYCTLGLKHLGVEVGFIQLLLVEFDFEDVVHPEIFVHLIEVHEEYAGYGYGNLIMKLVTLAADVYGIKLSLNPLPLRGDFSHRKLVNWYKKFGFVTTDKYLLDAEMYREPKGNIYVEEDAFHLSFISRLGQG